MFFRCCGRQRDERGKKEFSLLKISKATITS